MTVALAASPQVLIIDGDARRRPAVVACIRRIGLVPRTLPGLAGAEVLIGEVPFRAVVVARDLVAPQPANKLAGLLRADPTLHVIVIDGQPTADFAVQCVKQGAAGYVAFPGRRGALRKLLQPDQVSPPLASSAWETIAATKSPVMRRLLGEARRAAATDVSILVLGETGTGKGLLARAIHDLSKRSDHQLVTVDCASLGPERLMSELFGHVRGAFTDASSDHPGKVAQASGGTLLLDEIGEIPLSVQAMLLRFLQDQSYTRVGDPQSRRADVRIISTSSRNLPELVQRGHLREDLLYRLAVVELELPALRERSEDIAVIAQQQLDLIARAGGQTHTLAAECLASLSAHPWPGNLHELHNELRRAALLCAQDEISSADLTRRIRPVSAEQPRLGGFFPLQMITDEHIRQVVDGAPTLIIAAAVLGIQSSTLWHRRCQLRSAGKPLARDQPLRHAPR